MTDPIKQKLTEYSLLHTHIDTILRGRFQCVDRSLRGNLRFATKFGNDVQVLAPLTADVTQRVHKMGESAISVASNLDIPANALVQLYSYYYRVTYYDETTKVLYLKQPLREDIPYLTQVVLSAVPAQIRGNYDLGTLQLVIECNYPIYALDSVILNGLSHKVVSSNPVANNGYDVVLQQALTTYMSDGQECFLECSPYYKSDKIYLPNYVSLFDFFNSSHLRDMSLVLSGKIDFYDANNLNFDSLQFDDANLKDLFNLYAVITHDNLATSTFLTPCDLTPKYLTLIPQNGFGGLQFDCRPLIPNAQIEEWVLRLGITKPGTKVIYQLFPNPERYVIEFNNVGWQDLRLRGPKVHSYPTSAIYLSIQSNSPVHIMSLTPTKLASYVKVALTIKGDALPPNYSLLTTGLLVKPYFVDIHETDAYLDSAELDTGFMTH